MMVEREARDRIKRGTAAERKSTSSVTGPWTLLVMLTYSAEGDHTATRFRYPIQLPSNSRNPRSRIQSLQEPSTTPASYKGPRKRIASKVKDLAVSTRPIGK
jgi:hypothetical protein